MLEMELLPWLERVGELGDDVLEVGPGPGLTTDLLRARAARITAVELDGNLARALAERLDATNVEVIQGDASNTGFAANRFSAATCFSVLHHVPSSEAQDRILAEIYRVLRPGAALFATDSRDLDIIRLFHQDDIFVPFGDDTVAPRLAAVGFVDIGAEVGDYEIRFSARKPI
jgi:ubiquinone/menaquinone biosynthesis C-methylase UbiE